MIYKGFFHPYLQTRYTSPPRKTAKAAPFETRATIAVANRNNDYKNA